MTNTGTVIRPLERLLSISIRPLHTALVLTIVTVLPVLGGCSTNPATGEQSFTAFMSPEQERQVGQEQDPQIKKEFGGAYSDAELAAYGSGLADKPQLIALNKIDLADDELAEGFAAELREAGAERVFSISGATGAGMEALLDAVLTYLPDRTSTETKAAEIEDTEAADQIVWSPL